MNLNCETILDFYTHKNKKILCQIKVTSSKKSKFNNNNTCRCLKQEQWNTFDKELEKCITDNDGDWNDEKCLKFKIEPCIEVKVQKSKLSLKYFYKCLDAKDDYDKNDDAGGVGGDGVDIIEANYVLQCLLKFHENPFDVGRYEPLNETDTDVLNSSQLSCELYTPTKKRYRADNIDTVKTPGIELLEYNEDECSTNLKTCNNSEQPQLSEIISNNTSELAGSSDEVIVETGDEIDSPKINRFKKSKKQESAFTSNSQETNVADLPEHRKGDSSERTVVSKTDHDIRKHRKRTKTIDVVPNILDDNSKDKHKTKKERSSSRDKHSHKLSKKCSKTIDEVPPGSSLNNEKSTLKNWTDESKEKSCKKFEFTDKHKSHKTEDSKEKSCAKSESSDKHKSHKSEYIKENKHKKVDDSERSTSHKSEESKEKSKKKLDSSEKSTSHKSEESKEKQYKNKSEYIKENTHKKLDDTEKSTSHKSEESREKPKKKLDSTDKGTSLKSEESKENRHKKLDCTEQTTSHKSKEKKKDLNENITSTKEKKHERRISNLSSSEDDLIAFIISKKDKKTSEVADSDDEFEENNVDTNEKLPPDNDNTSNLNISISSATESNTDTSPNKTTKRGRKKKETNSDANIFVRRSERSPTKPYRFIDEQHILLKSNRVKKNKTSPKNKELFGTDDDDEENYFEKKTNSQNKDKSSIFETPVSKKSSKSASSSSSSSTKKKRKRDKSSECEQEKRAMGNWLSKKKSSSSDIEEKKASTSKSSSSSKSRPLKTTKTEKSQNIENDTDSHAKSVTPASSFELPSKEEIELIKNKTKLMQKENAILKAQLEKMRTSPPKEVEFKSLHDIPLDEILNTFSIYQTDLDEIYKNNCKRDYIKGHEGINHCFVIQLLPQNIQMKMLEKLTDVYSNTKSSTQATLYANALLPEWVLRVYMEKFKLNRQEAIHHIKAQEEYRLHVEEQSDNSFMFD